MSYSVEEKNFIVANRPQITIEKIEFSPTCATLGEESPGEEFCFWTKEALDAFGLEETVEGMTVTITMKDQGPTLPLKYIGFTDFIQVIDDTGEINYITDYAPTAVYECIADSEGRFTISVPVFVRKDPEDDECLCDLLCKKEVTFLISPLFVANEYVGETFHDVSGNLNIAGSCTDIHVDHITHSLSEDLISSKER